MGRPRVLRPQLRRDSLGGPELLIGLSLRPPVVLAIGLAASACPMRSAIWIVPGSTASRLEFGISDKRMGKRSIEWGGLTVYDCYTHPGQDQHVYWTTARGVEAPSRWPTRVIYGIVPAGLDSLRGPEILGPGCYTASVGGTGVVSFVIDSAGGVRELRATALGVPPDTTRPVGTELSVP